MAASNSFKYESFSWADEMDELDELAQMSGDHSQVASSGVDAALAAVDAVTSSSSAASAAAAAPADSFSWADEMDEQDELDQMLGKLSQIASNGLDAPAATVDAADDLSPAPAAAAAACLEEEEASAPSSPAPTSVRPSSSASWYSDAEASPTSSPPSSPPLSPPLAASPAADNVEPTTLDTIDEADETSIDDSTAKPDQSQVEESSEDTFEVPLRSVPEEFSRRAFLITTVNAWVDPAEAANQQLLQVLGAPFRGRDLDEVLVVNDDRRIHLNRPPPGWERPGRSPLRNVESADDGADSISLSSASSSASSLSSDAATASTAASSTSSLPGAVTATHPCDHAAVEKADDSVSTSGGEAQSSSEDLAAADAVTPTARPAPHSGSVAEKAASAEDLAATAKDEVVEKAAPAEDLTTVADDDSQVVEKAASAEDLTTDAAATATTPHSDAVVEKAASAEDLATVASTAAAAATTTHSGETAEKAAPAEDLAAATSDKQLGQKADGWEPSEYLPAGTRTSGDSPRRRQRAKEAAVRVLDKTRQKLRLWGQRGLQVLGRKRRT